MSYFIKKRLYVSVKALCCQVKLSLEPFRSTLFWSQDKLFKLLRDQIGSLGFRIALAALGSDGNRRLHAIRATFGRTMTLRH